MIGVSSFEPPFIQCLPQDVHDVFGRPVLLVRLSRLSDASLASKQEIVRAHEEMRKRLWTDGDHGAPILQFVTLLDLKNVAMRSMVR